MSYIKAVTHISSLGGEPSDHTELARTFLLR